MEVVLETGTVTNYLLATVPFEYGTAGIDGISPCRARLTGWSSRQLPSTEKKRAGTAAENRRIQPNNQQRQTSLTGKLRGAFPPDFSLLLTGESILPDGNRAFGEKVAPSPVDSID